MSAKQDKLLRWYPAAWRERYGDELIAMIEDESEERRRTWWANVSLAWHGLREHAYEAGLLGDDLPADQRIRAGSLLILCSWVAFMLAGASYSKASEHFAQAIPASTRAVPQTSFDLVATFGILGITVVSVGGILAVPAFVRLIRAGGWKQLRGPIQRATLISCVTIAGIVATSAWAHGLSERQRNGGDAMYAAVFIAVAVLITASLVAWTRIVVRAVRRMDFSRLVLRAEAVLAIGVTGAMMVIIGATALWWTSMAQHAAWFLAGTARGTTPSPVSVQLVMTLSVMLAAGACAMYGVLRIVRSGDGLALV